MDYAELVQRINESAERGYWQDRKTRHDAADAITALQARVAELTDELQTDQLAMHKAQARVAELEQARVYWVESAVKEQDRCERAEAELAAARALLTDLEFDVHHKCPMCQGWDVIHGQGECRDVHTKNCQLAAALKAAK